MEGVAEVATDRPLGHVGADEAHLALAVPAEGGEEGGRAGRTGGRDEDGDRTEAHARYRSRSARLASNQADAREQLAPLPASHISRQPGRRRSAAEEPVDLVAHPVALVDDVEEPHAFALPEAVTVAEETEALAPADPFGRPNRRARSSWASGTQKLAAEATSKSGAAGAAKSQSISATGAPARKTTFGG